MVLSRPTNERGVQTSIKLIGAAKSKIETRRNIHQPSYGVESCFYHFEKSLHGGSRQGRANNQTYTWPFEFTFPSGVQSTLKKERYSSDENFQRNPGHALPPSWTGGPRPEAKDYNSIIYTLEATVVNGVAKSASRNHSITLPFCPV